MNGPCRILILLLTINDVGEIKNSVRPRGPPHRLRQTGLDHAGAPHHWYFGHLRSEFKPWIFDLLFELRWSCWHFLKNICMYFIHVYWIPTSTFKASFVGQQKTDLLSGFSPEEWRKPPRCLQTRKKVDLQLRKISSTDDVFTHFTTHTTAYLQPLPHL